MRLQPRLRRRRAARRDQQPQLRQPRARACRLAAERNRCAASATPAARWAPRSSAATSRSTTRPPPGRSTRLPSSAWSGACPTPLAPDAWASPGRAMRSRSPARSPSPWMRVSWPSCAARPCPTGCGASDIDAVRAAQALVREAVRSGSISSAHDIAEGGIAIALAECCLAGGLGARVVLDDVVLRGACRRGAVRRVPRRVPAQRSPRHPARSRRRCNRRCRHHHRPRQPRRGATHRRRWGRFAAHSHRRGDCGDSLDELAQAHGALEKLFN